MKKLIFSAAMLAIAFSCNSPSSNVNNDNGQSQDEKNMANNLKVYTAIETGDMSPVDTLLAADAVDHDGPHGMDLKGKDSILHMLADLHNHIRNLKLDVISSAAKGDYIFTLVHVTGTSADSSMGAAGQAIDQKGVDVVKLNGDNKMVEHWGFTDDQQVSKEMMGMRNKMNAKDDNKKK